MTDYSRIILTAEGKYYDLYYFGQVYWVIDKARKDYSMYESSKEAFGFFERVETLKEIFATKGNNHYDKSTVWKETKAKIV